MYYYINIIFTVLFLKTCSALVQYQNCDILKVNKDFKVAVIEYEPDIWSDVTSAHGYMIKNLEKITEIINGNNEKDLDVIVFPEYALTSTKVLALDSFDTFAQEVPETRFRPCKGNKLYWSVLDYISCQAFQLDAYLVINLITRNFDDCRKDVCYYNTAIVFDRSGQLLATYDKYNVYEDGIDVPEFTSVTFETDFGAKIGIMICFDLNYAQPFKALKNENVDAVIVQVAWTDELPFLTAPQYHLGFAIANEITLIVAGYHDPSSGSMGSGIYDGKKQLAQNMFYDSASSGKLITAQIGHSESFKKPLAFEKGQFYLEEDLHNYAIKKLDMRKNIHTLNHNQLSCTFELKTENGNEFSLLAFDGNRTFGNGKFPATIQVCGLLSASQNSTSIFKFAKIYGDFRTPSTIMPVGLDQDLFPLLDIYYKSNKKGNASVQINSKHIYSLALYARIY